ncbi:hypothetical protein ACFL1U_02840 [Patescibacteria group bacterium]
MEKPVDYNKRYKTFSVLSIVLGLTPIVLYIINSLLIAITFIGDVEPISGTGNTMYYIGILLYVLMVATPVVGLIFSIIGLSLSKKTQDQKSGLAVIGLIISIVMLLIIGLAYVALSAWE